MVCSEMANSEKLNPVKNLENNGQPVMVICNLSSFHVLISIFKMSLIM